MQINVWLLSNEWRFGAAFRKPRKKGDALVVIVRSVLLPNEKSFMW